MAKKSLFSTLSAAFLGPEERSIEEIDREVEASVESIKATAFETVEAETVLDTSIDESGDTFFIMDLAPIYHVIGDRNSRLATGVEEICHRVFDRRADSRGDRGNIEGDYFLMLFANYNNEANFLHAALIVNEIGTLILSERFKTLDLPDPVVAVPVDDIINRDGTVNAAKMEESIAQGGKLIVMEEPDKKAPHWIKLLHEKKQNDFAMVEIEHTAHEDKMAWGYAKPEHDQHLKPRSSRDRRHTSRAFPGQNRRKAFDRRGRGY